MFLNLKVSAILGRVNSLTKPPPFGVSPNREPGIRGIFDHQETAWDLHEGHPLMQRPRHLLQHRGLNDRVITPINGACNWVKGGHSPNL